MLFILQAPGKEQQSLSDSTTSAVLYLITNSEPFGKVPDDLMKMATESLYKISGVKLFSAVIQKNQKPHSI